MKFFVSKTSMLFLFFCLVSTLSVAQLSQNNEFVIHDNNTSWDCDLSRLPSFMSKPSPSNILSFIAAKENGRDIVEYQIDRRTKSSGQYTWSTNYYLTINDFNLPTICSLPKSCNIITSEYLYIITPICVPDNEGIPIAFKLTHTHGSNSDIRAYVVDLDQFDCGPNETSENCIGTSTAVVGKTSLHQPDALLLQVTSKNHPNPFTTHTNIEYVLTEASLVSIEVFNVKGQQVAQLQHNAPHSEGIHSQLFEASKLPKGLYYYQLTTVTQQLGGKMLKTH